MKKFIWTGITTTVITIVVVYGWNKIVVDHFGYWNYPDWMAYGIVSICAFLGGLTGDAMNKINFRKWKVWKKTEKRIIKRYITKELR